MTPVLRASVVTQTAGYAAGIIYRALQVKVRLGDEPAWSAENWENGAQLHFFVSHSPGEALHREFFRPVSRLKSLYRSPHLHALPFV